MSELALLGFYTLNNGAGPVSNAALPLLMDEPRNGLREFSQTQIGRLTGAGNWSVNRATTETQFASGPRSWTLTTRTFRQGVEAWNRGCPEFARFVPVSCPLAAKIRRLCATSSGKLSRARAKKLYLAGEIVPIQLAA